jgi:hypothetical protein
MSRHAEVPDPDGKPGQVAIFDFESHLRERGDPDYGEVVETLVTGCPHARRRVVVYY